MILISILVNCHLLRTKVRNSVGQCKYCGEDAGLFSHVHKECEEKYDQGIVTLEDGIRRYFKDAVNANGLKQIVAQVRRENYVTDPDVALSSAKCIDEYTEKSRWPFHSHQLDLVRDYINIIGVSYQSINVNGSLDKLSEKMVRGFLAEYFTGQKPLQRVLQICSQITSVLPLSKAMQYDTNLYMLNQAAQNYLKVGLFTDDEEQRINEFVNVLGISLNNLPAKVRKIFEKRKVLPIFILSLRESESENTQTDTGNGRERMGTGRKGCTCGANIVDQ